MATHHLRFHLMLIFFLSLTTTFYVYTLIIVLFDPTGISSLTGVLVQDAKPNEAQSQSYIYSSIESQNLFTLNVFPT